MKIIVTAGGTSEPIDNVRKITNFSTGRLGTEIAKAFLAEPTTTEVIYIRTPHAQRPAAHPLLTEVVVDTIRDLETQLAHFLTSESIHSVIHSMAVSDFRYRQAVDHEYLIQTLTAALDTDQAQKNTQTIEQTIRQTFATLTENSAAVKGKLRSQSAALWFYLETNPKIIQAIKKWQPTTQLVGFKLLVDVPEKELIAVAQETLAKNDCRFVVANDLAHIQGEQHPALILDAQQIVARCQTKTEIAQTLVQLLRKEPVQ